MSGAPRSGGQRKLEPWQDPGAKPMVRISNATKKFGDVYAVDNVSLEIYRNEFFALLGPSGCGKTTLLRMLAGFETLSSGRIEIDGQDMAHVPPWKRPVNMMFQSYALFPHMSVGRNIGFGLRQDGLPRKEVKDRVDDALRLVRLQGFGERWPDSLSGGQRQRVALARAIVKRPKLVLLDEPLAALDRKLRERTQLELVNIQERLGITFIIVTHDQEEAMTVSTRMAIMNEGQVAQLGTPAEVYEYPANRFVADFVGDVNLLETRVIMIEGVRTRLACVATAREIEADRTIAAVPGETIWIALRPEKLHLLSEPPPDERTNCAQGTVADIAYLGDTSIYHVRLETGATIRAAVANRLRLIERPVSWDDQVWLTWHASASVMLKT